MTKPSLLQGFPAIDILKLGITILLIASLGLSCCDIIEQLKNYLNNLLSFLSHFHSNS